MPCEVVHADVHRSLRPVPKNEFCLLSQNEYFVHLPLRPGQTPIQLRSDSTDGPVILLNLRTLVESSRLKIPILMREENFRTVPIKPDSYVLITRPVSLSRKRAKKEFKCFCRDVFSRLSSRRSPEGGPSVTAFVCASWYGSAPRT